MRFRHNQAKKIISSKSRIIALYLILGLILQITFSICGLIFILEQKINLVFSILSFFSACIFSKALFDIGKIFKSSIFFYYLFLIFLCIILKICDFYANILESIFALRIILEIFFIFALYIYLHKFYILSKEKLFIISFWIFIFCIIFGGVILKLDIITNGWSESFILAFMCAPALIIYISAILKFIESIDIILQDFKKIKK